MEKYFFYKKFEDGNTYVAWDLSKSAAAKRYQRYCKDPDPDAKAWGWHPQNGSLTEKRLKKVLVHYSLSSNTRFTNLCSRMMRSRIAPYTLIG